jgi:Zn-dependent peptidase ImmA (M78 family)
MENAIEQLLEQTDLTAYRLSKHTGVSTQPIHYQKKKQYNLKEAVHLAKLLKQKGLIEKDLILVENQTITKI